MSELTRRAPRLDDLSRFVEALSPVLTPDGALVVYVVRSSPTDSPPHTELWVRPSTPGAGSARRLTMGPSDGSPAVSPDGRTVAFVRSRDEVPTLFTVPLAGGEEQQLTEDLPVGGVPVFSPDGSQLAFSALVDDQRSDPPAPLVVEGHPAHKVDGLGWTGTARTQVHVVATDKPAGAEPVRLTQDGYCSTPAWSPSGDRIAFSQVVHGLGDASLTQRVGIVDPARPGDSVAFPFAPVGAGGPLVWTPDGKAVIAIGTEDVSVALNRLLRLDVATGETTVLTAEIDRNVLGGAPGYPGGAPSFGDGDRLYFCLRDGGQTVLSSLDTAGVATRHDLGADAVVSALDVRGTRAVVAISDPTSAGELAAVDLDTDAVELLTSYGDEAVPDVAFLPTRPVHFTVTDGTTVHGWLLRAPDTTGAAPTLLDIHGGPHNAWTGTADTAHLYHQLLAAAGWNVLTLNPRGSDGYGEEFFRAGLGGWGEADQRDLLEPLDRLIADGLADPDRLAVAGYSYGGFMTCWLTAHTNRFRAAVAGGLVCDHRAMDASSDLGVHLVDQEIGDAETAHRLSPLTHIDRVETPTLILHGQQDLRCPLAQAELWYSGLRSRGVATRMVVYPGGSHTFFLDGPRAHRGDFNARIVDWLTQYVG